MIHRCKKFAFLVTILWPVAGLSQDYGGAIGQVTIDGAIIQRITEYQNAGSVLNSDLHGVGSSGNNFLDALSNPTRNRLENLELFKSTTNANEKDLDKFYKATVYNVVPSVYSHCTLYTHKPSPGCISE